MAQKIKNIILDLGDVLINLIERKTIECFGGAQISPLFNNKLNPEFIKIAQKFEINDVSPKEFRAEVCRIFNMNISDTKFDTCWNAMIGEMSTSLTELLVELKDKYRLFVLSNTNQIHVDSFTKKDYWKPELFERIYYSHELGLRKPDPQIFVHILSENTILPCETIFLDDNEENIKAAQKVGIDAILVESNNTIDVLKKTLGISLSAE
jgi:glucose-1-phosphatase